MEDWKVKLLVEQQELKDRLVKLVKFLNSEEYYQLSSNNRLLLKSQKIAMELYLNVLNIRVFGDVDNIAVPDYGMLQAMGGLFNSSWSSSPSNIKELEKQLDNKSDKVAAVPQHTGQEGHAKTGA